MSWAMSPVARLSGWVTAFGENDGLMKGSLQRDRWVLLRSGIRLLVPQLFGLLAYVVDLLLFVTVSLTARSHVRI